MNIKSFFKNINQKNVLDNHPDALFVLNFKHEIMFWNRRAQEVFGYTRKEVLAQKVVFLFEEGVEPITKALSENKSVVAKVVSRVDQDLFVELTASYSLLNEEIIVSARNVTQRQALLADMLDDFEKIKKINKERNRFIANMSHDLQTPIHSIIGFAQALIDGISGKLNEKQDKYISIIKRNADNLLELMNSIIDISRLESDKIEFKFRPFDIMQVISQVESTIRPLANDKRLTFEIDTTDLIKRSCYSDDNMLRQAILNLLDNAVKFTETGSVLIKISHPDLEFVNYHGIDIATSPLKKSFTDKSFILISVTDTGAGISENELNSVFNAYRKIDRTSKKYPGAGLGLAITHKIIEKLEGVIWVESEVMKGSTFSFILPIEKPIEEV